jgi:hypothetical protein
MGRLIPAWRSPWFFVLLAYGLVAAVLTVGPFLTRVTWANFENVPMGATVEEAEAVLGPGKDVTDDLEFSRARFQWGVTRVVKWQVWSFSVRPRQIILGFRDDQLKFRRYDDYLNHFRKRRPEPRKRLEDLAGPRAMLSRGKS